MHVYKKVRLSWREKVEERVVVVDTGSTYVVLPPELGKKLGVAESPRRAKVRLANGQEVEAPVATVFLEIDGRETPVTAIILPGAEPLVGVEALEALGLRVNPATGELSPPAPIPSAPNPQRRRFSALDEKFEGLRHEVRTVLEIRGRLAALEAKVGITRCSCG